MKFQRHWLGQCLSCCGFIVLTLPAAHAAGPTSCQPLAKVSQAAVGRAATNPMTAVSFQLLPGQLEPQIRQLLKQQLAIKVLDWQASPHHQWPTEYKIKATSWAELLRRVLQPYQLQLVLHANQSAVVRYRDSALTL